MTYESVMSKVIMSTQVFLCKWAAGFLGVNV